MLYMYFEQFLVCSASNGKLHGNFSDPGSWKIFRVPFPEIFPDFTETKPNVRKIGKIPYFTEIHTEF